MVSEIKFDRASAYPSGHESGHCALYSLLYPKTSTRSSHKRSLQFLEPPSSFPFPLLLLLSGSLHGSPCFILQIFLLSVPCIPTTVVLFFLTFNFILEYSWSRRRQWHPTPVLLPGKSHGQRSLVGCSPWGPEESDTTDRLHFHALEKAMATHSSVLAWKIPGTGEPGGLLSMGSHRVGHDWGDLAAAAA